MDDRAFDDTDRPPAPRGTLAWALKIALMAGAIGLGTTRYLAHVSAPPAGPVPMQVAGAPAHALADPETTGSIADGARSVRLDPCALGPSRGPRP